MSPIAANRNSTVSNGLSVALSLGLGVLMLAAMWPRVTEDQAETPNPAQLETPQPKAEQPVVLALPAPPPPPQPVAQPKATPAPKPAPVPVATPKPKPMPKVIAKPAPKPMAKSAPQPKPQPQPVVRTVQATATELSTGRPLLRILEHGKGPSIEIGWPSGSSARNALYSTLNKCYGLTIAMMDNNGILYRQQDPKGQRWAINLDRYSGFVRQPSGQITRSERSTARAISRHHRLRGAQEVRIFPRRVDAVLLGSLASLIGSDYRNAKTIRAMYAGSGRKVTVHSITVDGRKVRGGIDLSRVAACRRSP